ncbi:unnamed protein product, partial [Mycena citricolor]
ARANFSSKYPRRLPRHLSSCWAASSISSLLGIRQRTRCHHRSGQCSTPCDQEALRSVREGDDGLVCSPEALRLQGIIARADYTIAKASIAGTKFLLQKLHGYGGTTRKPLPPFSEARGKLCGTTGHTGSRGARAREQWEGRVEERSEQAVNLIVSYRADS